MSSPEEVKKLMLRKFAEKITDSFEEICKSFPDEERLNPAEKKNILDKVMKSMKHVTKTTGPNIDGDFRYLPPYFPETIKCGYQSWRPKKGSVLICTAGKTGTTWTLEIVRQLLLKHEDPELESVRKIVTAAPYHNLESGPPEKFDLLRRVPLKRCIFQTHLIPEHVNIKELKKCGVKFIYMMRNPKDVAVSLHKFLISLPFSPEMKKEIPQDLTEFTRKWMRGGLPTGQMAGEWYPHHIKDWMKYKQDTESFLFLTYEEMKKDPFKEIRKIADFIESDSTDDDVTMAVKNTDFETMKKEKVTEQKYSAKVNKGQIGNWRNVFSEELSAEMDVKLKTDLDGTNIQFIYD